MSRLVILHEEAEDGNAMPDLNKPVQAVSYAVNNLVKVNAWIIKHTILLIRRDTYTLRHHHQQTKCELTISKTNHMLACFFQEFSVRNSHGNCSKVGESRLWIVLVYFRSVRRLISFHALLKLSFRKGCFFVINGKLPRYFRGVLE